MLMLLYIYIYDNDAFIQGRLDEAIQCYSNAQYFHGKDSQLIRSAMERLHEMEDEDELRPNTTMQVL